MKMKKLIIIIFVFGFSLVFSYIKTKGLELSAEELANGFFYENKSNINEENFDYEINKICRHNNGFIVVGKVIDNDITVPHLNYYITYPYIAYYDQNGLVWSNLDKSIGHGEYSDAVFVNNEVVAIGSYELGDEVVRLLVTRFNQNGYVKKRLEFDANKTTFGKNILYENHSFYLIGVTNATHFLVDTNDTIEKIFILKLNEDFQQQKITFIHNGDLSLVQEACMANGVIYLYAQLNGEGEYDIDCPVPANSLFAVDTSFNNIDHTIVIRQKYSTIACNEDDVYVINSSDNLKDFQIVEYDSRLSFVRSRVLFPNSSEIITGLSASSSSLHEPVSIYISSSDDKNYEHYLSIDLQLNIINNVSRAVDNNNKAGSVFLLDGYYYLFSNINQSNDINKLIYIKEIEGLCYCNGEKCRYEVEEINDKIFGSYQQKVTNYYYNLEVDTYQTYVIPIKISIKDKSVYDRQVKLEFNGIGYLNNEKIESGYIVQGEGYYVLEVRGKDEKVYYTFEIKKLTLDENSYELDEATITFSKSNGVKNKSVATSSESLPSSSLSLNNFTSDDNNNYYVVIVVALISALIGSFIPFEKIHKKNKEIEDD